MLDSQEKRAEKISKLSDFHDVKFQNKRDH
jgi:hypothetical protein